MSPRRLPAIAAIILMMTVKALAQTMDWDKLPPLPDREGFASPFAGVADGALVVAGGANIPGDKWGETFVKKWYDTVFVLENRTAKWRIAGKLPRPLGYGISITTDDGLICLGGSDANRHYADVFQLRLKNGALTHKTLPGLPSPCANACGALVGHTIYIAGGIETPLATTALHTFWSLDLDAQEPIWRELEPWPGPERMLAVAGRLEGSFYLFSGARLSPDKDGKPVREYLRDAYRYTPGEGWKRLTDLPRPAVAAPSPAPTHVSRLVILSGDDGLNVTFQPIEKHPGFPRDALAYDADTDEWESLGAIPISRVTAPTVRWHDFVVIPNGEMRPRVRTPEVWSLRLR